MFDKLKEQILECTDEKTLDLLKEQIEKSNSEGDLDIGERIFLMMRVAYQREVIEAYSPIIRSNHYLNLERQLWVLFPEDLNGFEEKIDHSLNLGEIDENQKGSLLLALAVRNRFLNGGN